MAVVFEAIRTLLFIRRTLGSSFIGLIGNMTRIVQITGALLGTLLGFALGLAVLQRAGA